MSEIAINISEPQEGVEINISGNASAFTALADHLSKNTTSILLLKSEPNAYFPRKMEFLSTVLLEQSNGLITVQVIDAEFRLVGDSQAFQKLGSFLESLENLIPGEHFHLDWFANGDLLAPDTADMSFIFWMES